MGTYATVAEVRRVSGIDSTEISDVDVEAFITKVEQQVPRKFNTVFSPTERIDILDGDGTNRLLLDQNPVLSVRELKIDGTTEDPANLEIRKDSGYIFLGSSATTSVFSSGRGKVAVKYLYGAVRHSIISTSTTAATTADTSVSLTVSDISSFSDNDWIEIYGMDGHREVAQIEGSPSGSTIVVDQLVQTHSSGSKVTKLEIDPNFVELMNIISGIGLVARIIGQSYDENTGYSLGELQVQKGEPYTQWRETANQLIRKRDDLMGMISIRPYMI